MKHITQAGDMEAMLAAESAALFVWVNWSIYAQHGSEIFRAAQSRFAEGTATTSISWFVADLSEPGATPVAASLHNWLESQDKQGSIGLFPSVDLGNGSTVLVKNGRIVGFEPCALRAGADGLARRVETVFTSAAN